ncbi:MAG: hypothetical protein ACKOOF_09715 [Planctomycetaceae bacterium]
MGDVVGLVREFVIGAAVAVACVVAPSLAGAEDDVLVNIRGPLVGRVGEKVSFDVELVNRSGRNLEKLRVIDYFDSGFHHDASKSPIEQKGTIDLAAGTARRVTLEFTLDEPGRQCHRVEILDQAHRFVGGATECVQVSAAVAAPAVVQQPAAAPQTPALTPPPVATPAPSVVVPPISAPAPFPAATASVTPTAPLAPPPAASIALDLSGPVEALSGGVTEYVATIRNTGNAPSAPMTLDISWDDGLVPLEASDGYSISGSRVSWNLPAIEAGGQTKRQVNLRAQSPPNTFRDSPPIRACVRAELSGLAGGGVVGDHECLQIRETADRPRLRTPSEAGIRLSLADLDDPVRVGDATTLVCTIFNDGAAASGPLNLAVDLPRGARLVGDARVRVDDGRVLFDAIDVPPGRQQAFEITYKLPDSGRGTASASVSGSTLDGRLDRQCQTDFLP